MRKKNDQPEYVARHAAGAAPIAEEQSTTTEFPSVAETPELVGDLIPPVKEETSKKKRKGWFRRRNEERDEDVLLVEEPTEAEEEEVKVFSEEVSDDTREIPSADGVMEKTQVIELAEEGGSHIVEDDDEASQMMLDGFAEDTQETVPEIGQEEALRRIRQEKIQDFEQRREQHAREAANAEQAEETEGVAETEEEPLEDELPEEETVVQETLETVSVNVIRQRLKARLHRSNTTLIASILLEGILFFIAAFSAASPAIAINPIAYLVLQLVLFIGLIGFNAASFGRGLAAMFSKKGLTAESVVSFVSLITVIHTAISVLNTTGIADGSAPMLTAVAGLGLLLVQIAERIEMHRVLNDLDIMGASEEKLAIKRITDDAVAEEIGRPAVALGVPRVAYFRRTAETEACVEKTTFDPAVGFLRWYFPLSLGLSVAAALVYLLLNGLTSWIYAVTLFCGMLAISAPMALLFSLRTTLAAADKHAGSFGTAISDFRAVEVYGNMHAVALDAMELFPEHSVLLHGIKTFSGTRVDEAILDAASVCVRAGGPLSHVFRRMIVNKVDMLHEVDTLVYEQDMGLSGWISGRRILIGNRRLLDNHGIDIPSRDYEERYAKNGRQLVYLSIAGELSAMFVVSYTADPAVYRVLKSLTGRRVTLLVRTCDQNIFESLLTSVFDLNGFYVELLNAPAGRSFEALISDTSETEPAEIVSAAGSLGMMAALAQCRRLRASVRFFETLQAVFGIGGMALVAITTLLGGAMFPPISAIGILAGVSAVLSLAGLLFAKN